jgi:putative peptidoglycan lipid II flippase
LQTGNRVMIMPLTILAQAASVAAFPFMASDSAAQNWPALADFLRTGLRRLMFLSLPISVLLILNSRLVIDLLFGYGRFVDDPHAVQQTSIALSLYCIGLFAWAGQQFVARGFYALQDTVTPTVIGSFLTIFFFIPLCWIAARWGGVAGLALATSLGAMAHFAGVLLALQNKLARRKYGVQLQVERVTGTLVRTCAASFVMWLAGLVVLRILGTAGSKSADLVHMLIVTVVASGVFAVAAHRFEIPEWQWLLAKVTRRKRPSVV